MKGQLLVAGCIIAVVVGVGQDAFLAWLNPAAAAGRQAVALADAQSAVGRLEPPGTGLVAIDTVTLEAFTQLAMGDSYQDVVATLSMPGVELARTKLAGIETVSYRWVNPDGSNMRGTFQHGRLMAKAQIGLQ